MADDDVLYAVFFEHCRGDLARVSAFFGEMHVLSAQRDVGAFQRLGHCGNIREGNADDNVAFRVRDQGFELVDESDALCRRIVHFPVTCNDSFSHNRPLLLLKGRAEFRSACIF